MATTFRIASRQFGYPLFAASVPGPKAPQWSDRLDEAHEYVDGEDSPETKLKWWKAVAATEGLDPAMVEVVR